MSVRRQLKDLETALFKAKRIRVCCETDWARHCSALAGVYAIWDVESRLPVYVGETSGLSPRMGDLGHTLNHTFRRIVRRRYGLQGATEAELNAILAAKFEIAWIEVPFGRAELEEYLILRWRASLWNRVSLRLQQSEQYGWVQPADTERDERNRGAL